MEKELAGSIVLKVADHPEQVYAGRTEKEDSSYVDTAACARKDGDGVLVVYYRTTAEYVRNYSLSYQNCVQGYNPAVDGTIVVTASWPATILPCWIPPWTKTPPFLP